MSTKQQYNYEYLQDFCKENSIILSKDYAQEKITRDIKIEGNCKTDLCNEMFRKGFRQLTISGGFCKKCTLQNGNNKKIQTCLIKFGVEYSSQSKIMREKTNKTNLEKYGNICSAQNEVVKQKIKETNLLRYGVVHPSQNVLIKQKTKQTCLENNGVEYPLQSILIMNKSTNTCLKNNGVKYPMQNILIMNKSTNTCLKKYGHEKYSQTSECKEKCKQTCLINNGVEYPMQNSTIFNKSLKNGYKYKLYTYPSGNIIEVQGYEPYALDELLQKENISEENIIVGTKNVPEIWYLDANDKKHRYYVDIFIPHQNRMIEVKSDYTITINNNTILLKQKACKDAGYSCEIWVYNSKGEKVECII